MFIFPVQLDHKQEWQPYPINPYFAESDTTITNSNTPSTLRAPMHIRNYASTHSERGIVNSSTRNNESRRYLDEIISEAPFSRYALIVPTVHGIISRKTKDSQNKQ